jgi:hypothetical protein
VVSGQAMGDECAPGGAARGGTGPS